MKTLLLPALLAAATLVALPISAFAGPMATSAQSSTLPMFNGQISMNGGATYSPSSINFNGNANIVYGTAYGSFAPTFSTGCSACVTMSNISLMNYTPETIYTVTENNVTTSFFLQSFTSTDTGNSFSLNGMGYATLTGYANSPGYFSLTSQGGNSAHVSFSSTTNVPEPGSLALLGTALFGMGLLTRRYRQKSAKSIG